MGRAGWSRLARYGFGFLCILLALALLRIPVVSGAPGTGAIVALLVVLLTARWGGTGPALLATALVVLIAWPTDMTSSRAVRLALYIIGGVSISVLVGSLREARRRAESDAARMRRVESEIEALNADLACRVAELNTVLEVIPVGIGIAQDAACEHIRVNNYFGRLLGIPEGANASLTAPEGERPTHFRVLMEGREVPPSQLPLQLAAREGREIRDQELDIAHEDGRVVTLLESASPLYDASGRIYGSVGAFLDITELKRTRGELIRARDTAEAAARAKDLFLAMISHELRTPLAPALLILSAVLEDPCTPPELREELELVRQGITLEARLVDDLLDMTRAGAGKLRLKVQRTDLHAVVRQALSLCGRQMTASSASLVVELTAADPFLRADPVRLQQVVWNLVINACKFTTAGGRITVRTRREPGNGDNGDRLVLEVEDTGVGMDAALIERIFRPFEQGGAGLQRPGGLGLGLAIARTIAEVQGGSLGARSGGPGHGSVFTLTLPAEPRATAAPGNDPGARPSGPMPRRLLVVEDDPTTSSALTRFLRRRGADVTAAAGLAEALAAAERASFDLVISDLGLPDGSGLELARWLSNRGAPPAIAVSGYGSEEDIRQSLEAGFAAHLTKPIDIQTLEAAIRRVTTD
jgi:signal transduction histidine kinase